MSGVRGVVDLSLEQQMDVPFVRFVLNRTAIARYGLRADDVADAVETSFAGATVGRIFDRATAFDLVVKFDPASQADFERLADLPIDTPNGGPVPVRLLADVRREEGPNMVLRENVQRRIVISCNVSGRDLGGVVDDIRAAVAQSVPMPAGYRVEYGGQFESQQTASRRLLILGIGAIAGLFMLLVLAFGRARDALLVMLNLPLALIGGVAGVFLAGGVLSVASMIGFITLFGIATRNGIMLVSHIHHLMDEEGVTDFREAVERGASERLVPILMTAMAAGLALIPLAISGGKAGSEIQTPDGDRDSLWAGDVDVLEYGRRPCGVPEVRHLSSERPPEHHVGWLRFLSLDVVEQGADVRAHRQRVLRRPAWNVARMAMPCSLDSLLKYAVAIQPAHSLHPSWRSSRSALAITISVLPSCIRTAGPIPNTPVVVARISSAMMPIDRYRFWRMIARACRDKLIANGRRLKSSAMSATSAVSSAVAVPAAPIAMPTVA
jgi:hypothetical protein